MKFLRILAIIIIPTLGFVACQKSNMHPSGDCATESKSTQKTDDSKSQPQGRSAETFETSTEDDGTTVVGSGDDDRDGGNKKKKTR